MIMVSVLQEDIAIVYMYVPDDITINYMKQKLIKLKGEREKSTITAGDYNISLSVIGRDLTNLNEFVMT